MNLFQIAWKSIRQRSLASTLTALSVALGVMLMVAVLVIFGVVRRSFSQNSIGYHLIVGPKGSDLQLVLSAVYRIQPPIENIPYKFYEQIARDPRVEVAIPICLGDFTEEGSFPIVATNRLYFEVPYQPGRKQGEPGRMFQVRGPFAKGAKAFDAVIGSEVARENGWDLEDGFKLVHGGADSDHTHDEIFTVTGVLAPTNTPNDRTVFVMLPGFYAVAGHETPLLDALETNYEFFGHAAHEQKLPDPNAPTEDADGKHIYTELELYEWYLEVKQASADLEALERRAGELARLGNLTPAEVAELDDIDKQRKKLKRVTTTPHDLMHAPPDWLKEVTAIFVRMKHPPGQPALAGALALSLQGDLKKGARAQAVNPIIPMKRLQKEFIGNIQAVLFGMTILIVIVSGVGIFVSIYNSMADRRREIAVMRALGARRGTVFAIILSEAILLCVGGGLLGLLLGHVAVLIAAPFIASASGLLIDPFSFELAELYLIPGLVLLATVIGIVPGLTAYRTDVARALVD